MCEISPLSRLYVLPLFRRIFQFDLPERIHPIHAWKQVRTRFIDKPATSKNNHNFVKTRKIDPRKVSSQGFRCIRSPPSTPRVATVPKIRNSFSMYDCPPPLTCDKEISYTHRLNSAFLARHFKSRSHVYPPANIINIVDESSSSLPRPPPLISLKRGDLFLRLAAPLAPPEPASGLSHSFSVSRTPHLRTTAILVAN